MRQIRFSLGLRPRSPNQTPLGVLTELAQLDLRGPTSKGGEGRGREGKGYRGRG